MKALTKKRITAPVIALLPILIYFAAAICLGICASFAGGFMGMTVEEVKTMPLIAGGWLDEVGMGIAALCACVFVKKRNKIGIKEVICIKNFDLAVPLMLTAFAWSFGELSDHFCGLLLSNFMTVEPNRTIPFGISGVVTAVILAPIFEEIIFRFAGTELPRGAYSLPIICIADSLYFAAVHGYNVQGFLNVFVGGVCMAYVYCKTRNLLYTMLEHAIHNALCFIPLGDFAYYEKNGFVLSKWYWLAINAVLLAAAVVYYIKVFRKKYTKNYFKVNKETGLPNSEEDPEQGSELAAAV